MMVGLPVVPNKDKIKKHTQNQFGGYNHTLGANDGEIWDMTNMSSDLYPLLAPRRPRWRVRTLGKPNGLFGGDGLYWVDGTGFYADGTLRGTVSDSVKKFGMLGAYILIWPDKKYYNKLTGEFGSLEASWSGSVTFQDGTFVGEPAEANTIYAAGAGWDARFKVGDAVTISGCSEEANNNTIIVREIEGDYLRFYEMSFTNCSSRVTIKREVPDMDYICVNENRLWGCKGDTIYASKLGDPFNFSVFDGVATDSYAVDVGSDGDFTACTSYLGYPCFFKDNHIYKVYGDKPSTYQVMGSASLGVEEGSWASPAAAGEVLFYLSRAGIVSYSGGIPQIISQPFGTERYRNAVGGSDGTKYYVSMEDTSGMWHVFVFDTRYGTWHREDDLQMVAWAWDGELYFLDSSGVLWCNGNARTVPAGAVSEGTVQSMAETGDFVQNDPNRKGTAKIQLRVELQAGSSLEVWIRYGVMEPGTVAEGGVWGADSDEGWVMVSRLAAEKKRSFYLPVIPRRSDHFRVRLVGAGLWRLYSLTRENYSGAERF